MTDTSKSLDLQAHPMGASPAASKDAPTDEAVMVNIAGNAQDLERAKEHARLLLKRVAAGPVGDGLSHAEYALLCLYAHVATLTAQLEAERATGDETARHISRLLDHLARETARADKAVAEAKALREALEDGYKMLAQAFNRIHALPRSSDTALAEQIGQTRARIETALARATLAQPADGGAT